MINLTVWENLYLTMEDLIKDTGDKGLWRVQECFIGRMDNIMMVNIKIIKNTVKVDYNIKMVHFMMVIFKMIKSMVMGFLRNQIKIRSL